MSWLDITKLVLSILQVAALIAQIWWVIKAYKCYKEANAFLDQCENLWCVTKSLGDLTSEEN